MLEHTGYDYAIITACANIEGEIICMCLRVKKTQGENDPALALL